MLKELKMQDFLPISREDMQSRGIDTLDFVYVSGDAYVDHPSFGAAVISRWLESLGYTVGIIAQPDWRSLNDIKKLGRPRLGFLVSGGNIDSMVAHYTAAKKRRGYDYYSPGGMTGLRPDRAVIVYCNLIRQAFGDIAVIIGGLEASLRRFAHYDYWDNKVRRSILIDSRADILSYGMGERSVAKIAELLSAGVPVKKIRGVKGTAILCEREYLAKLKDGDYITLKEGCSIIKYEPPEPPLPLNGYFYTGWYRVGIDIPEGKIAISSNPQRRVSFVGGVGLAGWGLLRIALTKTVSFGGGLPPPAGLFLGINVAAPLTTST